MLWQYFGASVKGIQYSRLRLFPCLSHLAAHRVSRGQGVLSAQASSPSAGSDVSGSSPHLQILIPRLFSHLNNMQKTVLQATTLDLIYTAARLRLQIHKRCLFCRSLIAMALEMAHNLPGDVSFLRHFYCSYREWFKVVSVFGWLPEVWQHVPTLAVRG